MGNNQSTTSRAHRLSKPKRSSSFSTSPLAVDSPVSVTSRYADLSDKDRRHIRDTLLSPVVSEFGALPWLEKDEDALSRPPSRARGRPPSVLSRSNSRTHSRSKSLSCFWAKHGSSTRLNELGGSRVSLVSNAQADMDHAMRLLQEVKKNASPEDLAALHDALELPEEERRLGRTRRSSLSLTRRRSLVQIPGVATRDPPTEGHRRTWSSWRAPKIPPEEEAKWTMPRKHVTPTDRLVALSPAQESRPLPSPRAETPGDLDYAHLGGLKLGTLSIVNGAPSPAPSGKTPMQKTAHDDQGDYFTRLGPASSPLMMKSARRSGHVKSKSSVLPVAPPRFGSNLTSDNGPMTAPTPKRLLLNTSGMAQTLDEQPRDEVAKLLKVTNESAHPIEHTAITYAQDYQADIPESPFITKTWFNGAEDDEGFASDDANTVKEEAVRALVNNRFDAPATALETSGSTLFPPAQNISSEVKEIKAVPRPAPQSADSGYSSGGSLRVSDRNCHGPRSTMAAKSNQDRSISEQEVNDEVLRGTIHGSPGQFTESSTSESICSPKSPNSINSASSYDSTGSSTHKRLKKQAPAQLELPVVQSCLSIPEGAIPEVPLNVRNSFIRRLSNTHGMECITHTYPSKDHITTDEADLNTRAKSPSDVITSLAQLEAERTPRPTRHGHKKSLSLLRRKSGADREDKIDSPVVVDFGTMASALGSSPYDAAGPLRKTITSPTHPHQLGAAIPRTRSMAGMDSQAAAEIARVRSKDRAIAGPDMPQLHRRSHHNLRFTTGEAKAANRRLKTSHHDIPPVPTMRSPQHTMSPGFAYRMDQTVQGQRPDCSSGAQLHKRARSASQLNQGGSFKGTGAPQHGANSVADARLWDYRNISVEDHLRTQAGFGEATAYRHHVTSRDDLAPWSRYSGGPNYNHEDHGAGAGGSAGFRQLHSAASTKHLNWRNQFGLDPIDMPITAQRA